jgi:hypothetical protein
MPGVALNFDSQKNTFEAKRVGADNEARAAMCLVLRFFLQPRDHIELHQIAGLYVGLPVNDEAKRLVVVNLGTLDRLLDRNTEIALNNNPITYRDVLQTILYGDQAHANEAQRNILKTWREIGPVFTVLENFFESAVCETLRYILWLAAVNSDAIKILEQAISARR